MMERRASSASSNLVSPSMAWSVHAETSGPLPSESASTSVYGLDSVVRGQ
jgi:hypothetical protein